MRNLKRALSLALASVMLLGMMVVGTSASYADVDSTDNVEAIEVMQAVGVMSGDDKGNFNPDQKVTRGEMAVVMANLLKLNVKDFIGAKTPFTDVPEWAVPYVAACYADGITAGIGANQYGFNYEVTTAQAALMMMKALGYFQNAKDFGSDWVVATVKQGSQIELFDGISAGAYTAMTRNEVAQLALNTLKSTTVETDGNSTDINLPGDISISTGDTKYVDVTSASSYAKAFGDKAVEGNKYAVQLGEKLFNGDLKLNTNATDDFGRPGDKWTYKTATVGTYADEASKTYTEDVKLGDIYSDLGLSERTEAVFIRNGVEDSSKKVLFRGNGDKIGTGNGVLTEAYVDDNNNVTLVAIDTYVGQVNRSVAATSSKDAYIVIGTKDQKPVSGGTVEYETDGKYEDDAYVLYTYANGKVQSVALAEMVSGTVTSYTAGKSLNLGDTTYKYAAKKSGVSDITTKSDYNVYLDQYGYAIYVDEQEFVSGDYAYVLAVEGQGQDAFKTNRAKLVFTDGTTKVVETEKDYSKSDLESTFVTYKVNDNNTYTLRKVTTGIESIAANNSFALTKGTAAIKTGGTPATIYANSNTIFVVATKDGNDTVYKTYTGIANVPSIAATAGKDGTVSAEVYCRTSNMATIMYIDATKKSVNISTSSSDVTYVAAASKEGKIVSSDGEYWQYNAVVNGQITTIKTSKEISTNTVYGSVSYDSDDILNVDSAKVHDKMVNPSNAGTVKQSGNSTIGFGNDKKVEYWSVASNCKVFYIDVDGKITESSLSSISTDSDDTVLAIQDDGELTYIFIQEVTDGATDPGEGTSGEYSAALTKDAKGKITLTIKSTAKDKPTEAVKGTIKMGGSTTLTADLPSGSGWTGSANAWEYSVVIANTSSNTVNYTVDVTVGSHTMTTNTLLGG